MTDSTPEDDVPPWSAWVGRTEILDDIASHSSALGLDALLDHSPTESTELFPVGHWLQFTPTARMSELGTDGHPKLGGFMPPLPLPRRMWAGSSIDFRSPIRVGQRLRRTTTIKSITPKNGSTGQLCFVVLEHDVEAEGSTALIERQTIVYRQSITPPSNASSARPPREASAPPEGWDWTHALCPDEATLFRYSALTFNTHRIHYDQPYATEVEGYPGLVVHGPLSATYIVDSFLQEHPDATLTRFEFSARAPVFAREQIHVAGRLTTVGTAELAVFAPDGKPAVVARIEFR